MTRAGSGRRTRPEDAVPAIIPEALGDFAIVEVPAPASPAARGKTVHAGFFNEQWQ